MAKATKHTEEIHTFNLELSGAEAGYLAAVLEGLAQSSGYAADIEQALRESGAPNNNYRTLDIGDRVRVIDGYEDFNGRVGTLVRIDPTDEVQPYLVEFDDSDRFWVMGVERA